MVRSVRPRSVLLASALVAVSAGCGATEPPRVDDVQKVVAYIQPSIVNVQSDWTGYVYDSYNKKYLKNDQSFSAKRQCSGFAVNPNGYIVTAGHCVIRDDDIDEVIKTEAANWAIENNYYDKGDSELEPEQLIKDYRVLNEQGEDSLTPAVSVVWGVISGGVKTGEAYSAQVVESQYFDGGDAALLRIDKTDLQALDISKSPPDVGQRVVAAGDVNYRALTTDSSFAPTISDGAIQSKNPDGEGREVYELSVDLKPGMNGGPAVGLDHRVVGLATYQWDPDTDTATPLRYLRSTPQIHVLLKNAGVKNELGTLGRSYHDGLDAFFAGDRDKAVESFQKVLEEQPANELAKEYMTKAEALEGDGILMPLGIGFLALLVLGGGALAVWKARKGGGTRISLALPKPKRKESPGRIFISYRQKDSAYSASWLFDRLTERFGADQVFKDVDSIGLGDDFVEVITEAVGSCDVLLAHHRRASGSRCD